MTAGALDRRIVILRRPAIAAEGGNERGDYEPVLRRSAGWQPLSAGRLAEQAVAGVAEDRIEGTYTLRDDPETRLITSADRLVDVTTFADEEAALENTTGREFSITSAALSDRSGYRVLAVARSIGG